MDDGYFILIDDRIPQSVMLFDELEYITKEYVFDVGELNRVCSVGDLRQ